MPCTLTQHGFRLRGQASGVFLVDFRLLEQSGFLGRDRPRALLGDAGRGRGGFAGAGL